MRKARGIFPKLALLRKISRHGSHLDTVREMQVEGGALKKQGINIKRELPHWGFGVQGAQTESRNKLIDIGCAALAADELRHRAMQQDLQRLLRIVLMGSRAGDSSG